SPPLYGSNRSVRDSSPRPSGMRTHRGGYLNFFRGAVNSASRDRKVLVLVVRSKKRGLPNNQTMELYISMPMDWYQMVPSVIDSIRDARPASVLEVAVGLGKFGV